MPILVLILTLCLAGAGRSAGWVEQTGLPVLAALEAHPDSGLLALAPLRDKLLQLSASGELWHSTGGSGRGMGSFRAPGDVDASQGLQILVVDRDNRRLCLLNRTLQTLDVIALPREGDRDCDWPDLLASGGAGVLLVASAAPPCVRLSDDRGSHWKPLFGYGRNGSGLARIDAMALDGLDLWLLERRATEGLLVRVGIDGTRGEARSVPGLLLIRAGRDGPVQLIRDEAGLKLQESGASIRLPRLPEGSLPLDFLHLENQVWISREGAPALRCTLPWQDSGTP
ncbi:MAG: hypothetical protein KDC10_08335 [Calditrichaeota bacterium]|nr:hypothetical protein [Candidatus Cloacimonadota bacterium]MCB1047200.1 hypothetical protein [Calditrichota bacterium]MCB9474604.1 hypothetical protein [Candidatus Delongbacteria bacterium]